MMEKKVIGSAFNILAVCATAGFAGVMLCIGVSLGGYWRSLPPQDFLLWFAAHSSFVSNTIPLIVAPALIGLIGSLVTGWQSDTRIWWILSTVCVLAVLVVTFAYFVPSNSAFITGSISPEDVPEKLSQWVSIHYVRIALAFVASAFGCWAIRLSN